MRTNVNLRSIRSGHKLKFRAFFVVYKSCRASHPMGADRAPSGRDGEGYPPPQAVVRMTTSNYHDSLGYTPNEETLEETRGEKAGRQI